MPSIDQLIGLTVSELEALTDEQLLEHYKSVFDLEPQVPIQATPLEEDEDEEPSKPRKTRTTTPKTKSKMDLLKEQILKESQEDFFKL